MPEGPPLVSIIMACYNAESTISESIESVLSQTYPHWELVIVDDGSTDNTPRIIKDYKEKDKRISAIFQQENKGVAHARNKGLDQATGDYISYLDSDDLLLPDKIDHQLEFMKIHDLKFTYSSYRVINSDGTYKTDFMVPDKINYQTLLKTNVIGMVTGIYKKEFFGKVYFHDVHHEDYVHWLEMIKQIPETRGVKKVLAVYRLSEGSLSSNKIKTCQWQWNIYRNIENLSFWKSIYCMTTYVYHGMTKYK